MSSTVEGAELPKGSDVLFERLGFVLRRTQTFYTERHRHVVEAHGLAPQEFVLLSLIVAHEPAQQRRLGLELHIDRTSIVALVDSLELKGFATRTRAATDRRAYDVSATARGRSVLAQATEAVQSLERAFLAPLEPAAQATLRAALGTLVRHYQSQADPNT